MATRPPASSNPRLGFASLPKGARGLALATLLFWLSLSLYVPLIPGYARGAGATVGWIGVITGSYGITQLLLRVPTGVYSDRLDRRRPFVLGGCALAVVSAIIFAIATDPFALLVARALGGVGAAMWVAFTVMYANYFPDRGRAAVTVIVFANSIGVVIGQSVGPFIAAQLGTVTVFWVAAAVATTALLVASRCPEAAPPSQRTRATVRDMLAVLSQPALLGVSLLGALIQYLNYGAAFVFVFDWAEQELGASASDLGQLAIYSGVPAAAGTLFGGTWLASRIGSRAVVVWGFMLAAMSVVAVPLVSTLSGLYLTQAIGGVARGFTMPLLMSAAMDTVDKEQSATAVGVFQATYALGMTLGPALTGLIGGLVGLAAGFHVMGVLAFGSGIMAAIVLRHTRT